MSEPSSTIMNWGAALGRREVQPPLTGVVKKKKEQPRQWKDREGRSVTTELDGILPKSSPTSGSSDCFRGVRN